MRLALIVAAVAITLAISARAEVHIRVETYVSPYKAIHDQLVDGRGGIIERALGKYELGAGFGHAKYAFHSAAIVYIKEGDTMKKMYAFGNHGHDGFEGMIADYVFERTLPAAPKPLSCDDLQTTDKKGQKKDIAYGEHVCLSDTFAVVYSSLLKDDENRMDKLAKVCQTMRRKSKNFIKEMDLPKDVTSKPFKNSEAVWRSNLGGLFKIREQDSGFNQPHLLKSYAGVVGKLLVAKKKKASTFSVNKSSGEYFKLGGKHTINGKVYCNEHTHWDPPQKCMDVAGQDYKKVWDCDPDANKPDFSKCDKVCDFQEDGINCWNEAKEKWDATIPYPTSM